MIIQYNYATMLNIHSSFDSAMVGLNYRFIQQIVPGHTKIAMRIGAGCSVASYRTCNRHKSLLHVHMYK